MSLIGAPVPLVLERLTVSKRVIEMARLADVLVQVVTAHGGQTDRVDALAEVANHTRVSRSEMTLVLAFAKAQGMILTGSRSSQIRVL